MKCFYCGKPALIQRIAILIAILSSILLLSSCTVWEDSNGIKWVDTKNCETINVNTLVETGGSIIAQSSNVESNRTLGLGGFQERIKTTNISKWKFGNKVYDCIGNDCGGYTIIGDELRNIYTLDGECKYYRTQGLTLYEMLFTNIHHPTIEITKDESKMKYE